MGIEHLKCKIYYIPGGLELVGDIVVVGMASDFAGVVVDIKVTLVNLCFWKFVVVLSRLTAANTVTATVKYMLACCGQNVQSLIYLNNW